MGIGQKVFLPPAGCNAAGLVCCTSSAARLQFNFSKVDIGKLIFCGLFKLMSLSEKMFGNAQRVASGEEI